MSHLYLCVAVAHHGTRMAVFAQICSGRDIYRRDIQMCDTIQSNVWHERIICMCRVALRGTHMTVCAQMCSRCVIHRCNMQMCDMWHSNMCLTHVTHTWLTHNKTEHTCGLTHNKTEHTCVMCLTHVTHTCVSHVCVTWVQMCDMWHSNMCLTHVKHYMCLYVFNSCHTHMTHTYLNATHVCVTWAYLNATHVCVTWVKHI